MIAFLVAAATIALLIVSAGCESPATIQANYTSRSTALAAAELTSMLPTTPQPGPDDLPLVEDNFYGLFEDNELVDAPAMSVVGTTGYIEEYYALPPAEGPQRWRDEKLVGDFLTPAYRRWSDFHDQWMYLCEDGRFRLPKGWNK